MTDIQSRKLVLFDFDGVLADSAVEILACTRRAAESVGYECTPTLELMRSLRRMEFEEFGRRIGIPAEAIPAFVSAAYQELSKREHSPTIYDGIAEVVRRLERNCVIGVVTGNLSEFVRRFLQAHGLADSVSFVLGIDQPGSKAEKIRQCIQRTGIAAGETWMIGDAASDIEAAQLAGVRGIAVSWGYQDIELLQGSNPDHIIHFPHELLSLMGVGD